MMTRHWPHHMLLALRQIEQRRCVQDRWCRCGWSSNCWDPVYIGHQCPGCSSNRRRESTLALRGCAFSHVIEDDVDAGRAGALANDAMRPLVSAIVSPACWRSAPGWCLGERLAVGCAAVNRFEQIGAAMRDGWGLIRIVTAVALDDFAGL